MASKRDPKLVISFFSWESKRREHTFLEFFLVDTKTTTTKLITVQDDVVGNTTGRAKITFKLMSSICLRKSEWMVSAFIDGLLLQTIQTLASQQPHRKWICRYQLSQALWQVHERAPRVFALFTSSVSATRRLVTYLQDQAHSLNRLEC